MRQSWKGLPLSRLWRGGKGIDISIDHILPEARMPRISILNLKRCHLMKKLLHVHGMMQPLSKAAPNFTRSKNIRKKTIQLRVCPSHGFPSPLHYYVQLPLLFQSRHRLHRASLRCLDGFFYGTVRYPFYVLLTPLTCTGCTLAKEVQLFPGLRAFIPEHST
jgi:hypothetical protein